MWTDEDWLYLAGVLNLSSHLVVGYALSHWLDCALVIAALRMGLFRRGERFVSRGYTQKQRQTTLTNITM